MKEIEKLCNDQVESYENFLGILSDKKAIAHINTDIEGFKSVVSKITDVRYEFKTMLTRPMPSNGDSITDLKDQNNQLQKYVIDKDKLNRRIKTDSKVF